MRSSSRTAAATVLILASLSACTSGPAAAPGTSVPVTPSAAASTVAPPPSAPPTAVPPSKPAGIPKTPTDIVRTAGWVEGTVTRGGGGPCYGLVTFDGVAYAMYSDAGVELAKGDHIRARLTPAKLRISCGDGTPVAMGDVQHFP
jgi:hypothetical protein